MASLLALVSRRPTLSHVKHIRPVSPTAADGLVAQVYEQVEREFGMLAPPLILHSPVPEMLAAGWTVLRETLLVERGTTRAVRELVASAVSQANACPYCVDIHSSTLSGLVGGHPDAAAVAADRVDEITDPHLRALARWGRASGLSGQLAPAPFHAGQAPELIGTAVTFHYINRMVNIFLPDTPLPPGVSGGGRRALLKLAARVMGGIARRSNSTGQSLGLLPPAALPSDMAWAAGMPDIAAAWSRAAEAYDACGRAYVPERVRLLLLTRLNARGAEGPGLSNRVWLETAVQGLPLADQPVGRLVMLTAFAAYQVTPRVIEEFRRDRPGDDALVAVTGWAAMTTARRIGARLAEDLAVGLHKEAVVTEDVA
ncbi:carboxymuconolactone decarboxylase family protein [Catellatospora tritici]|uniref:carboxymuconolactone decarboxylase family protein n=1 Tax=Catellatospora tritici TaxID=2851566 RepID=UPI001C2D162E|nr:carboxymuconolactone decarboxylase family protein [Catellatospora tritici]MBV1849282.1 carboxymuconolactone decarboxylase family protein [Catellatospora tritici]